MKSAVIFLFVTSLFFLEKSSESTTGNYYENVYEAEHLIVGGELNEAFDLYLRTFEEIGYLFNIDLYNAVLLSQILDIDPQISGELVASFYSRLLKGSETMDLKSIEEIGMEGYDPDFFDKKSKYDSCAFVQLHFIDQCFYSGNDRFCSKLDSPFDCEEDLLAYTEKVFSQFKIPFPNEIPIP